MISHRHRFIFVHHERTAGTSMEGAFGIERGRGFVNPEQPDDEHHFLLSDYRARFPVEYEAYFRFCFVRNPWERFVSRYANLRRRLAALEARPVTEPTQARKVARARRRLLGDRNPPRSFREALDQIPENRWNLLFEDGRDVSGEYHLVGRFERLEEDWAAVCSHLGLQLALPAAVGTGHGDYRAYYNDETRAIVAERCAPDIELLGYRFEDGPS